MKKKLFYECSMKTVFLHKSIDVNSVWLDWDGILDSYGQRVQALAFWKMMDLSMLLAESHYKQHTLLQLDCYNHHKEVDHSQSPTQINGSLRNGLANIKRKMKVLTQDMRVLEEEQQSSVDIRLQLVDHRAIVGSQLAWIATNHLICLLVLKRIPDIDSTIS